MLHTNRRYCNRRIGEFLKELELAEGRSTGFELLHVRLRRICRPSDWKPKPANPKPQRLHSHLDLAFPTHERQRACVRPVNHVQVTGGQDAVLRGST